MCFLKYRYVLQLGKFYLTDLAKYALTLVYCNNSNIIIRIMIIIVMIVIMIPIVIGALGTVSERHFHWLEKVSTNIWFGMLQIACLLGIARVLRYMIDI